MSTEENREALRAEIARRRAELSALDHERAVTKDEVARLETELAALDDSRSSDRSERAGHGHTVPETPAEKVALFRSLFRGRDDVHPRLWTNSKSGRTGYAPACANEWVRGVCEKPRVRCGECPNQAFTPVSDQVIADHLQGRHVLGVYPLLLDETFRPYPDQWLYLANIERVSAIDVERIAADARRSGQVLGVRPIELDEGAATAPWRLSPSRPSTPPVPVIGESLPEPVRATLAQRLFVNKDGLPSSVLNALKRIAAFQNPEFYKKQSMRLSTALTPRVVACAEDFPEHVAIPRGCVDESISLFRSLGSTL